MRSSCWRKSRRPCIFVGWGARDATAEVVALAEWLDAPTATTLQGLSAFPGNHPLHVGFGFGASAVPAAQEAFKGCDCMIAIGTRFAEIATGSYGVKVPENLIHIDINPKVFSANYPAKVAIAGDARAVLERLLMQLEADMPRRTADTAMREQISEGEVGLSRELVPARYRRSGQSGTFLRRTAATNSRRRYHRDRRRQSHLPDRRV